MNCVCCSLQVVSSGNASFLCLGGAWFESWDQLAWLKFVVQLLSLQADTSVIFSIMPRQFLPAPSSSLFTVMHSFDTV